MGPNGRGDQNALHGGCPPAKGLDKWSGNKWIHTKSFRTPLPKWMPDHPGLKRYGWREDALEQLTGAKHEAHPDACELFVSSRYSLPLSLSWVNPTSQDMTFLATIEPGGSSVMNSFVGHRFRLSA